MVERCAVAVESVSESKSYSRYSPQGARQSWVRLVRLNRVSYSHDSEQPFWTNRLRFSLAPLGPLEANKRRFTAVFRGSAAIHSWLKNLAAVGRQPRVECNSFTTAEIN